MTTLGASSCAQVGRLRGAQVGLRRAASLGAPQVRRSAHFGAWSAQAARAHGQRQTYHHPVFRRSREAARIASSSSSSSSSSSFSSPTHSRGFHSAAAAAAPRDYYEVLGVDRGVNEKALKGAYLKLVKKYHPDVNPDAKDQFQEINAAYEVLSDAKKRAMYDQHGHAAFDSSQFNSQQMDPEELLRHFGFGGGGGGPFGGFGFGGGMGGSPERPGQDIEVPLRLDFMEAINGTEKEVRFNSMVQCKSCSGSGAADDSKLRNCDSCSGTGVQTVQNGFFAIQTECRTCNGLGKVNSNPCQPCRGKGNKKENRTVKVKIPPGVNTGNNVRLVGQGGAGEHGGPAGNLFIRLSVLPDRAGVFRREGNDVHVDVPISLAEAIAGGEVSVPTLTGSASVKLPEGTQSGEKRVLRNRGVQFVNRSKRGHQYLHFNVEIPAASTLTDAQREALDAFVKDEKKPARDPKNWQANAKGGSSSKSSGSSSGSKSSSDGESDESFFKKMFGG